jgi:cobalt-precorrin-5B (C1)-methyltransferase
MKSPGNSSKQGRRKKELRSGFSTGTAAAAAARAALRHLLTGSCSDTVSVRLPSGDYLAIPVAWTGMEGATATARVIKDAGDDPDITNGAEIKASVSVLRPAGQRGILLKTGKGIGMVTKPGLPVIPGEPAVNPVPRQMLAENISLELQLLENPDFKPPFANPPPDKAWLHLPFCPGATSMRQADFSILVELEVPKGEELARHTLNPRLGIVGGISILGTTGIVKPFSNEAYEQTITAALSVAASSGCGTAVLSTGGKSERFAMDLLKELPSEAFVQIADFFSFGVREARRFGFSNIIHSLFFGKAIKMAQGCPYTHARTAPLELNFLAATARSQGYDAQHCRELASANTARHALEIIAGKGSLSILDSIAATAAAQSARLAGDGAQIRLLLFDYGGRLLVDMK